MMKRFNGLIYGYTARLKARARGWNKQLLAPDKHLKTYVAHKMPKQNLRPTQTFSDLILELQQFWGERGCIIAQPYDMQMGAGTFHPSTFLRANGW